MSQSFTKLGVAKHQLVTAIQLFLQDHDPVSIYTLASNAWEVVDALGSRKGFSSSVSDESREHIESGLDLKRDYVNPYRNFFKHADQDPDAVLTGFDDRKNDGILYLAAEDYIRLNRRSPLELQVYQTWFLAVYVEKVAESDLARVMESIEVLYPGIANLERSAQKKFGLIRLREAYGDVHLRRDARTELPFNQ